MCLFYDHYHKRRKHSATKIYRRENPYCRYLGILCVLSTLCPPPHLWSVGFFAYPHSSERENRILWVRKLGWAYIRHFCWVSCKGQVDLCGLVKILELYHLAHCSQLGIIKTCSTGIHWIDLTTDLPPVRNPMMTGSLMLMSLNSRKPLPSSLCVGLTSAYCGIIYEHQDSHWIPIYTLTINTHILLLPLKYMNTF